MNENNKKAFQQESGQFICHVYADIETDYSQVLDDMISIIQREQSQNRLDSTQDWVPNRTCDEEPFHITLIRGHRAIYYHQIKFLIEALKKKCDFEKPFSICLDDLNIFNNFESTKQFLCLTSRENNNLLNLKEILRTTIDQFAIKLTSEDETGETVAHCSFMSRDFFGDRQHAKILAVNDLNNLFESKLGELPICQARVRSIQVRIGNHTYNVSLNG